MEKKTEIKTEDLKKFLANKRVKLSCGHWFTLHNFSNTMIVYNDGRMVCHGCGY